VTLTFVVFCSDYPAYEGHFFDFFNIEDVMIKKIDIPEKILNSIKAKYSSVDDCSYEISKISRKREILKIQMWAELEEGMPDIRHVNNTIDTKNWTIDVVESDSNPSPRDFFKNFRPDGGDDS